jgi:agmatinase
MLLVKLPRSWDAADAIIAQIGEVNENGMLFAANVQELKQDLSAAKQLFGQMPFFIGGNECADLLKAFSEKFPHGGAIIFDAHASLEKFGLRPENIVLAGVRSIKKGDMDLIKSLKYFPMKEFASEGTSEVCDAIMAAAKDFEALFVVINICVVDPAFAPGGEQPVPAGMTSRELIYCIQRIKRLKNVKAFALLGLNSAKDQLTMKLAAKIVLESY